MRKLLVFDQITLDGYFCGPQGDLSWAHAQDPEWTAWVEGNARGGGELLFGRRTYDMMVAFWPTPAAAKVAPVVAERMNAGPKVVFSRTMERAAWNNTRLVKDDLAGAVRELKRADGPGLVLMGSGTIVAQLAREGLVDEYQLVTCPVVLGEGRTLFEGVGRTLRMKLLSSRAFSNGNVVSSYAPA